MIIRFFAVSVLAIVIVGCAVMPAPRPPPKVVELRSKMERYLVENGFTCAAPRNSDVYSPQRMPEQWLSVEDIAETRRCDFSRHAYSYEMDDDGNIEFIFQQDRPPNLAHFAGIRADGSVWVNESYCGLVQQVHIRLPR